MCKQLISASIVLSAAALAPPSGNAQPTCLARELLIEQLPVRCEEVPVGRGLQSVSQLLEIWTSVESGSYTVFVTGADGIACIVATGHNWSSFEVAAAPAAIGRGAPTPRL